MLIFNIARRYLFAKKSTNIINIITGISILGISIGTAALIMVFSVFNGFGDLLTTMLNNFNPDLKITPIEGKFFKFDDEKKAELLSIEGVLNVSKVIEEIALFEYNDSHEIGLLKGVDHNFNKVVNIDSTIIYGEFMTQKDKVEYLVFGIGMQSKLGLNINDPLANVKVYMPINKKKSVMGEDFITRLAYPAGTFSITGEADYSTVISSYDFASNLLKNKGKVSNLELKIDSKEDKDVIIKNIQQVLGDGYEIRDRYDQEASFIKLMNIEKWVGFLIGSLMLFLITFNLAGLLWIVVLDKRKDIAILKSIGMVSKDIKKIFLLEGLMIATVGCVIGILIALLLYFLQVHYGLISISSGLVDAYPIKLRLMDFLVVSFTLLFLSYLSSILPARRAANITAFVRSE